MGKNVFFRLFEKGIYLEQHKEPALSLPIQKLIPPENEQFIPDFQPYEEDRAEIDPKEIIRIARLARIVDERDGVPLFRKLKRYADSGYTLLIDAVDDEPYISSQIAPMLQMREQCAAGIALAKQVLGTKEAKILVYRNLAGIDTRLPQQIGSIPILRIGGRYPAETSSDILLEQVMKEKHLLLGACSMIYLARAAYQGLIQTTTFLTVAGSCIGRPCNVETALGLPVQQLIDFCNPIDEPTRVVIGGSMTGISISDTEQELVMHNTRGVLAFDEQPGVERYRCVGCGRCIDVCPKGLNPMLIYRAVRAGREDLLVQTDYQHCIGCMCCSYCCPAKINLAEYCARLQWKERSEDR